VEDGEPSEEIDTKPDPEQLNSDLELPSNPLTIGDIATSADPSLIEAAPAEGAVWDKSGLDHNDTTVNEEATTLTPEPSTTSASRGNKKTVSKPKFTGRRSQARLQDLQKAEDDRRRAESAKASAATFKAPRGGRRPDDVRGGAVRGRGRGRGGYMGDTAVERMASGAFGAGEASEDSRRKKRAGAPNTASRGSRSTTSAASGSAENSSRSKPSTSRTSASTSDRPTVKQEPGSSAKPTLAAPFDGDVSMDDRKPIVTRDGGYISSDDEDGSDARRVNIDRMGVIDLTEDNQFAPVRVVRVAHREKTLGVNAEGATDSTGVITIDANDSAAGRSSAQRRAKHRDGTVEPDESKTFQATYSDSDSDDVDKSKRGQTQIDAKPSEADLLNEAPSSPELRRKAKERIKARTLSAGSSEEDQDRADQEGLNEAQRRKADLKLLRHELGVQRADSEAIAGSADGKPEDPRAEKVYLFQFPPLLPALETIEVKTETDPDPPVTMPEKMNLDAETTTKDVDQKKKLRNMPTLPTGIVGKLKVHASGRVTLDWGGTSFCVGMGAHANFLQDVLIADFHDTNDDTSDGARLATSMGRVTGKFVCTPDFDEMLA